MYICMLMNIYSSYWAIDPAHGRKFVGGANARIFFIFFVFLIFTIYYFRVKIRFFAWKSHLLCCFLYIHVFVVNRINFVKFYFMGRG